MLSALVSSNTPFIVTLIIALCAEMDDFRTYLNFLLYNIVFPTLVNLKVILSFAFIITMRAEIHPQFNVVCMRVGYRLG